MSEAGQHDMFQLAELFDDGGVNARVAVTEQIQPPRTHRIQIALAIEIVEPDAATALDGHQWQGLMPLHLRAGMPNGRAGTSE